MIDNNDVLTYITNEQKFMKEILANKELSSDIKNTLLEYSFIKCVVLTQEFISKCFDSYASGISSVKGYTPNRKLSFESSEHLHYFFKDLKKGYIDTFENGIKEYSKHIFIDDPFALIIQDSKLWTNYNKAIIIRNYLMHKSPSSIKEYREKILNNDNDVEIIPSRDLLAIKKGKTLYSSITESLKEIAIVLLDPRPYF